MRPIRIWSVPPAEPPPHETLPGLSLNAFTRSARVLCGDWAGTTITSHSLVRRAMGVTWLRLTGDLLRMMPPTITMPPIITAFGSPLAALTNCASPMVPAAPPLLSNCTEETSFALCMAAASVRPVWSHPPPGFAGIIILSAGCAAAAPASAAAAHAAAQAARTFPSFDMGLCLLRCARIPPFHCSRMIEITNLVKKFGAKRAVDGISFTVQRGEVLGFLGPNGAGKSTTMRMITGFMPPTSGKVSIGGHDVAESPLEAKRLIGYLPENAASYPDMTVHGFLNFTAELRGLNGNQRKKAVERVVELCFLQQVFRQSIDTLSKGYKHRTCLAQALVHDPEVLIMDEPTDGLDPNQKHEVRNLIRNLGKSKAIVFSTHILEEVDAACTRAIIIDRGRIVANGTPEELRNMSDLAGAVTLSAHGATAEKLGALGRVEDLGGAFRVYPRDKAQGAELARAVVELVNREGWKVEGMFSERGELDEVFRRITLPDTVKQ